MSCVITFTPKRTEEIITYGMDYKNVLASGEVIQSAVWSVEAVKPSTASVVGMVLGSAGIFGTKTTQQIQSGIDQSLYSLISTVTTNQGNRLSEHALLEVSNSAL